MRLLDLVEQDHAIRAAAHRFGELATLVVTDVARGRANQASNGELLHVLAHVDAHHRLVVVEQVLRDRTGKLGLTDTRRAEEHERADRAIEVGEPRPRSTNRVRHSSDSFVLADHALMQLRFEVDELEHLALHQAADWDAGPLADDLGDVFRVDLFLQHAIAKLQLVEVSRCRVDAALEFGNATEANFGGNVQVGLALELRAQLLKLFLQAADGVDGLLLCFPVHLHLVHLRVQQRQFIHQRVESFLRRVVGLVGERDLLDLQLQDAPLHDVDLGWHRIDLDAQLARGLVHQVDRLVGQEAICEVAVRQHSRADQRAVLNAHTVVYFVALL